jgi:hypothetical protein
VLDVDDDADNAAPPREDLSDVDVKAVVEDLFNGFFGGFSESATSRSTYEG